MIYSSFWGVFLFQLILKTTEDTENFMSSVCVWFDEIIALGPADILIGVSLIQNQNLT